MDKVLIDVEEYEGLLASQKMLEALEAAGVDNWSGFDYAHELMGDLNDT